MILITGCAGYIGSELCKKFSLLDIGYIGVDNLSYSYKNNIFDKKKFINCCISNEKKISFIIKKFKIKIIIHTAAFAYVNEGELNKKKYYINNVLKTKKFILIVSKYKIKQFYFFSSSNIYSKNKNKFLETNTLNPKNYYGKTKFIIEKFLYKKKNNFGNIIILRLFNIIGLTKKFKPKNIKNFKYQRLLFKIYFNIKKQIPISLNFYKKLDKVIFPTRDFLDITDLTSLIIKLLKSRQKESLNIFNVGKGKSYSLDKIVKTIELISNQKFLIRYEKLPGNEYQNTLASIKKLKKNIYWKPKISLIKSIRSYDKYLDI